MPPPPADPLTERRLLLFTGKGGVGKSTIVAALAAAAAARGQRPLVVELGHRASMSALLADGRPIGHEPAPIAADPRLSVMNLDRDAALYDHVLDQVKVRGLARRIVEGAALRGLFRAAPMVRELVTLTKLAALVDAREGGRPRHQPILVDLDASGHALMLLDLPRVLIELAPRGPLATLGRRLAALVDDPSTLLALVTLAREVPAQETIELRDALARRGHRVRGLVVNQVPRPPIPAALEPVLAEAEARAPAGSPVAEVLDLVRRRRAAHDHAAAALAHLRARLAELPRVEVDERARGPVGVDELRGLGEEVLRDMSSWTATEGR